MIDCELCTLEHSRASVAEDIRRVMAAAYRVEGDLLGVTDFPPLRRTAARIAASRSDFIGAVISGALAAVAEIDVRSKALIDLSSLVVHPDYARRGLGSALARHVIAENRGRSITVSTGVENEPALQLYDKLGFVPTRRWETSEGIPMLTLVREAAELPRS